MKEQSIEELIYAETEKRLDAMEKSRYEFPKRITRTDWILIGGSIVVSLMLIILCMIGVIV